MRRWVLAQLRRPPLRPRLRPQLGPKAGGRNRRGMPGNSPRGLAVPRSARPARPRVRVQRGLLGPGLPGIRD
eukprot:5594623-Pyramimonas_sp.AAC.1